MRTEYPASGIIQISKGGTGANNAADARKNLQVVRSNQSDDSILAYYNSETNDMFIGHNDPATGARVDIQATQGTGIYLHTMTGDNNWTTTPQAISIGGTGATNRKDAAANLALEFRAGDTLNRTSMLLFGYVTENTTRLIFEVPLGRQTYGLSNVTFTSFHGVLRGVQGYLDNINTDRNLLASPFTGFDVQYSYSGLLRVIVTKNAAFTNVVNNTPIACLISYACTLN